MQEGFTFHSHEIEAGELREELRGEAAVACSSSFSSKVIPPSIRKYKKQFFRQTPIEKYTDELKDALNSNEGEEILNKKEVIRAYLKLSNALIFRPAVERRKFTRDCASHKREAQLLFDRVDCINWRMRSPVDSVTRIDEEEYVWHSLKKFEAELPVSVFHDIFHCNEAEWSLKKFSLLYTFPLEEKLSILYEFPLEEKFDYYSRRSNEEIYNEQHPNREVYLILAELDFKPYPEE